MMINTVSGHDPVTAYRLQQAVPFTITVRTPPHPQTVVDLLAFFKINYE
jgi:hypothetical protein